jgi:mRNA-degrading endonuclease YafQ of YafQ-DinJ toxin-antitoxin module
MSYFIFLKNMDNIEASIYKIAENQNDLNNLNIIDLDYKIIEDSQDNFNLVKYGTKILLKYNNNDITYVDGTTKFATKEELQSYVNNFINEIKQFTNNNPNHPLFSRWNDYKNQLSSLNLDSITYPMNISLEQYFNASGQPSLNPLQIP